MTAAARSVHANCVVIGEHGVLIRGPSGAGKSSFSERLVAHAQAAGLFARLVADDRTVLETRNGRLLAAPPSQIAGLIERRGVGVVKVPWLGRVVVRLVADLAGAIERMPEEAEFFCDLNGMVLPRLALDRAGPDGPALVLGRLVLERRPSGCDPLALAFARQRGKIIPQADDSPSFGRLAPG